jgi:hypothetical protein
MGHTYHYLLYFLFTELYVLYYLVQEHMKPDLGKKESQEPV